MLCMGQDTRTGGWRTGEVFGIKFSLSTRRMENLHGEEGRWMPMGKMKEHVGSNLPVLPAGLRWSDWIRGTTGGSSPEV